MLVDDELVSSAAVGLDPDARPAVIRLGEGIVGSVAMTNQPRFVPDVTQEPDYVRFREDVTSEICVPVSCGGNLVGVLNVEGTLERPLTLHDLHLLQSFAEHAGILLNNAQLYGQLQTLASRDPMTDLLTERELQRRLREELARAERHHRPLSLLVVGVDQLQQVNDRFGPATGDELLQAIAEQLSGRLRPTDTLARSAADAFVVMLPESNREEAFSIAERLIEHVRARPFEAGDESFVIALSIGLATYPDDALTSADLIQRASDAMRRASRAALAPPAIGVAGWAAPSAS
jgi:diguanylate cyclase (GGDEF)-like protein